MVQLKWQIVILIQLKFKIFKCGKENTLLKMHLCIDNTYFSFIHNGRLEVQMERCVGGCCCRIARVHASICKVKGFRLDFSKKNNYLILFATGFLYMRQTK